MSSLIKRVQQKLENKILLKLRAKKKYETLYTYRYENGEKTKILLYFPLAEYMHLGDHLFFEPLAKILREQGYNVYISPSKSMEFYFERLGYKIYKEACLDNFDLIISRTEFFKILKNEKNILLYEYINTSLKEKICIDIIKKVFLILDKNIENVNGKPTNLIVKKSSIKLDENKKYILFNNYLDSGRWITGKKYIDKIEKQGKELKKQGYELIHLGTKKDLEKDNRYYEYINIDLRGKTSVEDLFYLSSLENVKGNLGFDGFLMHLFFLNKKTNYICLRNKITSKRKMITKQYLNPPFEDFGELDIKYIN